MTIYKKEISLYKATSVLLVSLIMFVAFSSACLAEPREIVLKYDGQVITVNSALLAPKDILVEAGVKVGQEDKIIAQAANFMTGSKETVELKRAVPVTIIKYGLSKTIYTSKDTVKEVLDASVLAYEGKEVYPPLSTKIKAEMKVYVLSVADNLTTKVQDIEIPVEYIDDREMVYGQNEIITQGKPGKAQVVLKTTTRDSVTSTEEIAREVIEAPQKSVIKRGMGRSVATSRGQMRYSKVVTMEATAYTINCGSGTGLTSIGIAPYHGIVAVDPKVIPYYTRMYIPGYGVAMAGDTGGAIVGNKIDLFMDDINDAWQWGRRNVQVYILEE